MGFGQSKEPKPIHLSERTIEIKCEYIMNAKKVHTDREVANLERSERLLLERYPEKQRTLDDLMFRDEIQMCAVAVRKIQAVKKGVYYVRFLNNAKKFISESNQVFDRLPETSKMAIKNIVYLSTYVGDKEIVEFAQLLKRYYINSEEVQQAAHWEGVDAELRRDCMVVKNQSIPSNELIDYYIDFMNRNNLMPIAGQFGRNIPTNNMGANNFGGNNFGGNNFGGNDFGGNNFGGNNFGGGNGGQLNQNNQMMYQPGPQNNQMNYQQMQPQQQQMGYNQQPMGQQQMGQPNLPHTQPGYNVGQPVMPQNDNDYDEFSAQLEGLKLGKGDL